MPRDFFREGIRLIKAGFCLSCFEKHVSPSGFSSYFCSCGCTMIIGTNEVIVQWYEIRHGERVLENRRFFADSERWKAMVEYIEDEG